MKSTLKILTGIISLGASAITIAAPAACTMDYTPVCGKVQVQCIKAPCYPIYQTFGNKCALDNTPNATYVKDGECGSTEGAPVILSEKLRASLTAQYTAFFTRFSSLSSENQIKSLQGLVSRIDARKAQIELTSAITIERRDILLAALALLRDLAQNDITVLQNIMAGAKYMSRNTTQCQLMDYLCAVGTTPFSDATGCGCKN